MFTIPRISGPLDAVRDRRLPVTAARRGHLTPLHVRSGARFELAQLGERGDVRERRSGADAGALLDEELPRLLGSRPQRFRLRDRRDGSAVEFAVGG